MGILHCSAYQFIPFSCQDGVLAQVQALPRSGGARTAHVESWIGQEVRIEIVCHTKVHVHADHRITPLASLRASKKQEISQNQRTNWTKPQR